MMKHCQQHHQHNHQHRHHRKQPQHHMSICASTFMFIVVVVEVLLVVVLTYLHLHLHIRICLHFVVVVGGGGGCSGPSSRAGDCCAGSSRLHLVFLSVCLATFMFGLIAISILSSMLAGVVGGCVDVGPSSLHHPSGC